MLYILICKFQETQPKPKSHKSKWRFFPLAIVSWCVWTISSWRAHSDLATRGDTFDRVSFRAQSDISNHVCSLYFCTSTFLETQNYAFAKNSLVNKVNNVNKTLILAPLLEKKKKFSALT